MYATCSREFVQSQQTRDAVWPMLVFRNDQCFISCALCDDMFTVIHDDGRRRELDAAHGILNHGGPFPVCTTILSHLINNRQENNGKKWVSRLRSGVRKDVVVQCCTVSPGSEQKRPCFFVCSKDPNMDLLEIAGKRY